MYSGPIGLHVCGDPVSARRPRLEEPAARRDKPGISATSADTTRRVCGKRRQDAVFSSFCNQQRQRHNSVIEILKPIRAPRPLFNIKIYQAMRIVIVKLIRLPRDITFIMGMLYRLYMDSYYKSKTVSKPFYSYECEFLYWQDGILIFETAPVMVILYEEDCL